MSAHNLPQKVNWLHVVVYYALACAISWPFFWWRDIEPESWKAWQVPGIFKTASYMIGPGISGIICLVIFRKSHRRTISFAGTSWIRSLVFWFVPFLLLAAVGVPGENGSTDHITPLTISVLAIFSIYGEEMGWRGFLQDALRPLSTFKRYALIGLMWELWHFTTRTHNKGLIQIVVTLSVTLAIVTVLSYVIGQCTERSKSVMVAAAFHGWFDLSFEMASLNTFIVLALSLGLWAWLLYTWDKPLFGRSAALETVAVPSGEEMEVKEEERQGR